MNWMRRRYKSHSRRSLLAGMALLLFSVIMSGCSERESDPSERIRVHDFQYQMLPGGARILTGSLENRTDDHLSIAQIQVSLFDADNRRISSMYITVRHIDAGTEKSFREAVDSNLDVRGARIRSVLVP